MPLLSIIVPVYNAEHFLNACVDSILAQEFSDFELILVNDGSIDRSGEQCEQYAQKDQRVKVIHQKNQGQATARNCGLKAAQGSYIGFSDHDDTLHPDMFSILVNNALSENADISAASYEEKDAQGQTMHTAHSGKQYCWNNQEGMREFLDREKMDIYIWTKIYKRQLLEQHRIQFEAGRNDEDFLFNHQAFLHGSKTVFTDQALYTYYVRETSESRVFYQKEWRKYLHNTLYRTYKIEAITRELYPELLELAKRQTIRYHVMMLGRALSTDYKNSEPYYSYMMRYQKQNRKQVITQRAYWGMSLPGVWAMVLLPPKIYFLYRRLVKR